MTQAEQLVAQFKKTLMCNHTHRPPITLDQLSDQAYARLWDVIEVVAMGDSLSLVKHFGNEAPYVAKLIEASLTDRHKLVSEYWREAQQVPFIFNFVMEGVAHEQQ